MGGYFDGLLQNRSEDTQNASDKRSFTRGFAEKVNISTTHMSHIETGSTKLSLPVFVDIAAALDVHTDELLRDEDSDYNENYEKEICLLLKGCSPQQARVIMEIVKAARSAMDKHLSH